MRFEVDGSARGGEGLVTQAVQMLLRVLAELSVVFFRGWYNFEGMTTGRLPSNWAGKYTHRTEYVAG